MRRYVFATVLLAQFFFIQPVKARQGDAETRVFKPAEMQQDFNYLRKALEETHPGLYMHHTREGMKMLMDSLYNQLDKPMGFYDFYKIIAYLIAEVKCEHTSSSPYDDFNGHLVKWRLLPLQIFFGNNKAYVVVNRTADTSFTLGDEVLAINRHPIDSIKQVLYRYMTADGDMEASKDRQLSTMAFSVYYYLYVERPDAFDITFKNAAGQVFERHFDHDLTIKENMPLTLANPANKKILELDKKSKEENKQSYRLKLMKDSNMAIMTISDFTVNKAKLFKFYETSFTTLAKENIGNLIIGLDNNGGGDEEYVCELLSYLIKDSARFMQAEYLMIGKDNPYIAISNLPKDALSQWDTYVGPEQDGKFYIKAQPKYSAELKTFYAKPNRFKGKVYFYVNGGTSSAASTCAGVAKSQKLGVIVGEETAGCYVGGGSTNVLNLTLPNSKIIAHTSILYCRFGTEGGDKDRGVIPDYPFAFDFKDWVANGNKQWLSYMYNLIQQNK